MYANEQQESQSYSMREPTYRDSRNLCGWTMSMSIIISIVYYILKCRHCKNEEIPVLNDYGIISFFTVTS